MKRTVEPEWLDELPALDPLALASRRDLQRLNRIMGHARTMCGLLRLAAPRQPPRRIVELGAGDGTFMLQIAKHLAPAWNNLELVLVDCKDAVSDETRRGFERLGWRTEIVASDVFDFLKKPSAGPADVMIANLFLHQFSEEHLKRLMRLAAERTLVFAACEPRRAAMPLAFSRLVGLVGCNAVTRNDAPLSVRAGFAGGELSALWPARSHWRLRERRAKLFTHTFLAERTAAEP
jgi:predicted O-methyltransferase YrrM